MTDPANSPPAVGALVVTHGELAAELVAATERIVGPTECILAVSLDWDDPVPGARERIEDALAGLDCPGGVIIFTDMFGGTPTNVCLQFLESGVVEIVTGVNLPMLVKLTTLQRSEHSLDAIAAETTDRGRSGIHIASEVVSARNHV